MKNRDMIVREISKDTGFSQKDIRVVIESFEKVVKENIKNDEALNFCGFGKFVTKKKAAQEYVVPSTGEKIHLPKHRIIRFEASELFKKYVNE